MCAISKSPTTAKLLNATNARSNNAVNSSQRRQTRRSTRHTILRCDELTCDELTVSVHFLRRNGPRYSYQKFTPYAPWGFPYNAIEISTLTPKNFEKLWKNFWGWGPGAPGGRRVGVCPKLIPECGRRRCRGGGRVSRCGRVSRRFDESRPSS